MPFDSNLGLQVLAGASLWMISSWLVYRILASVKPREREWIDRTALRRIFWVVASPLFWLVLLSWVALVTFHVMGDDLWSFTSRKMRKWKEAPPPRVARMRARRAQFLSDV